MALVAFRQECLLYVGRFECRSRVSEEGKAEVIPGVLFIDEVLILLPKNNGISEMRVLVMFVFMLQGWCFF